VVFGGQEIIAGDESLPYYPVALQHCPYNRTKTEAERLVMSANGLPFPPGVAERRKRPADEVRVVSLYFYTFM
jgi:hypothetical protein